MVSNFPIDPMHAVYVGVTDKMFSALWNNKTPGVRLSDLEKENLQTFFLNFIPCVPAEFERKHRTFKELGKLKANEFRQLILYTGIVLFKDIPQLEMYNHFLLLSCAIRMLDDVKSLAGDFEIADQFIQLFVEEYQNYYGIHNFTYNTHLLLHLKECVDLYGTLNSFSAFF